MKNTVKQDYFIINSPEDELKQISLVDSVQKGSYQSPRISKKSTQKFAIDSWDISQKLKPLYNQSQRYKQTYSTKLSSPSITRNRFRAKSAYLIKDRQNSNDHNFNSKKKNTVEINSERKTSFIFNKSFNSIQKAKILIQLPKQTIQNKRIKSKHTIQRQNKKQQQERTKTIQSYLIHQKQVINRQKQILMSQRIGKEGIQFCMYPTQYWSPIKLGSPLNKTRKKLSNPSNQSSIKISKVKEIKFASNMVSPTRKSISYRFMQECHKSTSTESQSPIKRFKLFKDKLHQVTIH